MITCYLQLLRIYINGKIKCFSENSKFNCEEEDIVKIGKLNAGIVGASLLFLTGFATHSYAGVSVNLGISAPLPTLVVPGPPSVVVIPGTYVYAVPNAEVNMLFYHGYWWRPYEGGWYRSSRYNGSWAYVRPERVPRAVIDLPPDYRRHLSHGDRIAHADMQRNWKNWERDRHWDKHDERHEGR